MSTNQAQAGPIEAAARTTVAALPLVPGSTHFVMGQLAIGLAKSTDMSTSKGHSAAAAQSGRELREVLGKLYEAFEVKEAKDSFDTWLETLHADANPENLRDSRKAMESGVAS